MTDYTKEAGIKIWGKIPADSLVHSVAMRDPMGYWLQITSIREGLIQVNKETAYPWFSVVNNQILIHAAKFLHPAKVQYSTIFEKEFSKPKGDW